MEMEDVEEIQVGLIVPRDLVERKKNILQAIGKLDKRIKIRPITDDAEEFHVQWPEGSVQVGNFYIPTTVRTEIASIDENTRMDLVNWTGMQECSAEVGFVGSALPNQIPASRREADITNGNLLTRTIEQWFFALPCEQQEHFEPLSPCRLTYMIYPPLLLLPPSSFLSQLPCSGNEGPFDDIRKLYALLCKGLKVTHIAVTAPIPANSVERSIAHEPSSGEETNYERQQQILQCGGDTIPNNLRSPTGLTPVYGNFGPVLPLRNLPRTEDFEAAFWCTSRQNGIFQIWAPRYTMFSRGNISEKARILNLESLTETRLGMKPEQTSVVDLYAGIGYFAFSYARAAVGKVFCWEINPWSVDGLRRGAEGNKWGVKIIDGGEQLEDSIEGDERLLVFSESNEHAAARVNAMRDKVPPVKHVNCGLLPSSKDSWEVAVQVLDRTGGWIHAHENIARKDLEMREEEILERFGWLTQKHYGQDPKEQRRLECEHVELVKSYAPGVMHCVLDIKVTPLYLG